MTRRNVNRRRFLKAVGATALTYPFLRSLPGYAAPTSDPQYLILLFTPCGIVRYPWGALGPTRGTTAAVASPLTGASGAGAFRATLQPFTTGTTDLTSQTIVLDGLNVGTANGSHEAGMGALWTGCFNSGAPSTSVSIDQAIASQLNAGRSFNSIPLMVRDAADFPDTEIKTRMIYGSSGGTVGFVPPIDSPAVARSTLFPTQATSAASSSGPDKKSFIRQQIFAQTNSELTAIQSRMCTEDRVQLQIYQSMWNTLDQQLAAAVTASAGCTAPESVPTGTIDFPTSAKLQMDILALALACDLSRVASLQFSTATSQVTHSWIGATQTDTHHNYSHMGPSSLYSLAPYGSSGDLYDTSGYSPPFSQFATSFGPYMVQLPAIDLWYATQVAYLAQKLASLQTASGKNLLSQSVICWGSELDMGAAHNHDDSPFILVGGGGGKLKTKQLVQFPLNLAGGLHNNPPTDNRFHNDLLITLAQVMGVPMTTFGTPSGTPPGGSTGTVNFVTGPITEILA
jgi:hypothetical protein